MRISFASLPYTIFALAILFMVTLFGGKHPFLMAFLPIFSAVLLAATAWSAPVRGPETPGWSKQALFTLGVFLPSVLVLMLVMGQMLPLDTASPLVNPFWGLLQGVSYTPITLNPGLTILHLAVAGAYVAFAAATLLLAGQGGRPLIKVLALSITAASFYGIFIFATGNSSVLWLPKTSYQDALSATFINRNSFATLAGLGILACLGLMLQRVGEISGRLSVRERWHAFYLIIIQQGWPWLIAAFICFTALVLTSSRAGLGASGLGVLVFLGSIALMRRPARWPLLSVVALIATVTIIVLLAIGSTVSARLTQVGADAQTRDAIYDLTHNIIDANPTTGTGFGTFPEAFTAVRSADFYQSLHTTIEHAHNTYLELTAELGYPGAALLGLALLASLVACLYGLKTRRRAITWPALGLAAIALTGSHALADFSFSVPAVTLVTLTMVMLGVASATPTPAGQPPASLTPTARHILMAASLLLGVIGLWQALSNYHALRAEPVLNQLEQDKTPTMPALQAAKDHLATCMNLNPYHPTCIFGAARLELTLATEQLTNGEKDSGMAHLKEAQALYTHALTRAPANPHAWFRLARMESFMGNKPAAVTALVNSLLTGPNEPKLSLLRIPVMLNLMGDAAPENQDLFQNNIRSLWQSVPWDTAQVMAQYPTLDPYFATVLGDNPTTRADWKNFMKTPFPQPLGEAPAIQ